MEKSEFEKELERKAAQEQEEEIAETLSSADAPEQVDDEALEALRDERDQLQDQLLRARAEFDNYRKRMARESEQMRKRAGEALVRDLLPVVDHLHLAIQHGHDESGGLYEGVKMVAKQFGEALEKHGVKAIPALGEAFDPNVHDAMTQMPSEEYDENVVMQEYQRGYMMGDQVLRPAKVVVSAGPSESPAQDDTSTASDDAATQNKNAMETRHNSPETLQSTGSDGGQ